MTPGPDVERTHPMDLRFALLLACFFLSGLAALLYQTAWSREISFVFGTSDLAVAAVLAAYMGGLTLGAAAAARWAGRIRRPVLVYGVLELGIALCALLVPLGIRALDAVYGVLLGGEEIPERASLWATLFQLGSAFAVLLPPTALMGATLPLLTRHAVDSEEGIARRVGLLYAVNTAGAIAGTLVAAFWLMPEIGLRRTVWFGAALNAVVFALAAALARRAPAAAPAPSDTVADRARHWILPAIAASGAVSFTYEVLWTRLLGHLLGASIHAFATMLASFLLGITLGSAVASRLAATRERALLGFALAQLGIAATSYLVFQQADALPALSRSLGAGPAQPLASAALAGAALLPITLFIGSTFPFAVRILATSPERAAAATARVYAWNTVGAIVGALGAGFVLLPLLGFEGTATIGVALSLVLAAGAALAATPRRRVLAGVAVGAGIAVALVPAKTPWQLLTSSPFRSHPAAGEIVFAAVGRTTTVIVNERHRSYYLTTDGLPEAAIDSHGMLPRISVAEWLGALPAFVRPDTRELLVVGLGGGVVLELAPSTYDSIDVIELEPEVIAANRSIAALRARDPLADPRVRVHVGDARGTLRLVDRRFDAIVSQPSHPWTAGASHLYTREFFSLARSRLAPGGVFVQWIGIRFADEALLRSLLAALVEVFPHVEIFQPQSQGLLFAASDAPIAALEGAARSLRESPGDLARLGIHTLEDFASRWVADAAGTRALAAGAPVNSDDHNLLAARSGQLADDALSPEGVRSALAAHDPLAGHPELPLLPLVRALLGDRQATRAGDLARAADGAEGEVALGWVELAARRNARAARHFDRALELDPDAAEAVDGLIASQRGLLVRGTPVRGVAEDALDARRTALIAGWRSASRGEWERVKEADAALAAFGPGGALFAEAMRLRIEGRVASGTMADGAAAQALAEQLLLRHWGPEDALLRARAAIRAGDVDAATASLGQIATQLAGRGARAGKADRALARRVLGIARELPEDRYAGLREILQPRRGE